MDDEFAVYRAEKIKDRNLPVDEVLVERGFLTAGAAMDRANELAREDRASSYLVGLA